MPVYQADEGTWAPSKRGAFLAAQDRLVALPAGARNDLRIRLVYEPLFDSLHRSIRPAPAAKLLQSALYKMVHIAKDSQAAGVLTSNDYHASLKTNLARTGVATSGVDVDYISGLPWIVTEDFTDPVSSGPFTSTSDILFLQYTSGSTMEPKGVIVTHKNILNTCSLVIDHPSPVVVSWLPQYHDMGLIGCYLYPRCEEAPHTAFSAAVTSFSARFCGSTQSLPIRPPPPRRLTSPLYCSLRAEEFQKKPAGVRPQKSVPACRMCAAELVKPTPTRGFWRRSSLTDGKRRALRSIWPG